MSYIPSLRPHSAKSGKQTQWATSDRRILIIPPRLLAPASSLWSPAVGSEDITATRVVLAAARRVGLTAPMRLKSRSWEKNSPGRKYGSSPWYRTTGGTSLRSLYFYLACRRKMMSTIWAWNEPLTCSPQCLPPRHRRKMFRQTRGFAPPWGRFVQDSCLEDYGGLWLLVVYWKYEIGLEVGFEKFD